MKFKYVVYTTCFSCSVIITGCGAIDFSAGRTTNTARETCNSLGFDDIIVDFGINIAEANKEAGFSELQSINNEISGCRGESEFGGGCPVNPNIGPDFTIQQCILNCSSCFIAIIAEVYR